VTSEEKVKYWVDLSNDDFVVVDTLMKNGHNLYALNIEARYPDYKNKLSQYLTNERTQSIFNQTKELLQWTKEKI